MTISHVGAATGAATSFALPAHNIGDLIVIFAFRDGSATPPSLPSGYTTIATRAGTSCSSRLGFKIATATNDTSGAWTNSTTTSAVVWTSSLYSTGGSLCVGTNSVNSGTTNTINFAALASVFHADSTSWIAGFVGHRSTDQNLSANPPSGMTFIASSDLTNTAEACAYDTNATANSWGSTNITGTGTASGWTTQVVEIVENQPGTALANIVQHISFAYNDTNATGETNDLFVFPFDPTLSGNGLALGLVYPTGTAPTITDDKGNTWPASPEVVADPGSGCALAFWHINNATTGTSQINVSWGGVPKDSVKAWVTQLFNVTGTVESTNTWKLVGTAPASGVLTPGSQTPSVNNCLVLSYMAFADKNVGVNPALIIAETGYNLNDADISWGTNGIPNASQYALQTTATATTPRFYLNFAGVANNYNVISIALSTGSQGTPKPSGAGVAPWIDRILHFGTNSNPTSWLLQIPCTGNAIVCRGLLSDTGTPHLTSLNDNDAGSYTLTQPGGTGTLYIPNRVNISTGRSNRTMTVGMTGTGANMQWIIADVSNCAVAPVVASAGTPTNSTTNTTIAHQPDITPTATNQLTLAYQQLGVGPYWGVTVPTGAVLELPLASVWQGTASIATSTLTVTATTWGPAIAALPVGSNILSDAGSHVAAGTTLQSGTNPYGLSASQGTVLSETMTLSTSDVNTISWGNACAHYFNSGSTAQQQWTWGIAQQPGGGGGFGVALILAGPPSSTVVTGWFNPWDQPNYSKAVFSTAPAFVSTFKTAAISGIGWFEPPDIKQPPRLGKSDPPGFGTTPPQAASTIAGMAWFEPPDKNRPAIRINGESPPAYDARPPQVPISGIGWFNPWEFVTGKAAYTIAPAYDPRPPQVPISGMGWFEPRDIDRVAKPPIDAPPAFGRSISAAVPISGMAWFEPWDRDKIATRVTVESPPALQLIPGTLPTPVSGIAWFEPPDRDRPTTKVTLEAPPAQTLLPPLLISQIQGMAWFTPLDYAKPIQAFSQSVAYVSVPPAGTPISGMGWFEPPDRDRIAIKVTLEASPAIQLIPGTLPAPISGMAWFQPWPNTVKLWPGQSEPPAFEQPIVQLPPPLSTLVDVDIPRELWRRHQKRLREVREARERQDRIDERIRQIRRSELRRAFEKASGAVSEALDAIEAAPVLAQTPDTSELTRDLAKIIVETRMPQALRKSVELIDAASKIRKYYEELREEEDLEIILLGLQ